jgi:hypothetical protein
MDLPPQKSNGNTQLHVKNSSELKFSYSSRKTGSFHECSRILLSQSSQDRKKFESIEIHI